MHITVTYDFTEMSAFVDRMVDVAEKEAGPIVAEHVRYDTLKRFDRGVDHEENPFQKYSAAHAKTRQKLGYQTSYVDHTMTGQLRGSLRYDSATKKLGVPPVLKGQAEGTIALRDWLEPSQLALDVGALDVAERLEGVR